ncbi:MAG: LacI family DNA-binding transcriptional regulator [Roseiflexaceae bacterium]|nr:LacI family DNA-binding transcriptional regulator [Roseiflexaceae bacterium]
MAITIRQVASLAQVSTTTVSYVLNGTGTVTEATRRRVLAAVTTLGYQPHHAARSMRGRSETLGLVLQAHSDRLADPAYAEMLAGLADGSAKRGYLLLIATVEAEEDEPQLCLSLAQTGRVDGLVLLDPWIDDQRARVLANADVPHVCAGPGPAGSSYVALDGNSGAQQAVGHLLALGHRRIGLIQIPSELADSEPRYQGYAQALTQAGIAIEPELIVEAGRRQEDGYQAIGELLDLPEPPSAVLACSDDLAFGALHALHDAGLVVGSDVSLVGFDDLPLAAYTQPPLTTLRQPRRALGEQLAELLDATIRDHTTPLRGITLAPRLVVRKSSGPPKGQSS